MGYFSGHLMSSASDQKLFCEVCSAFKCSLNELVGEKVIFPSYSSAILAPLLPFLICFQLLLFLQLFLRPPQTTILPFCISFRGDDLDHCLLYNVTNLCP